MSTARPAAERIVPPPWTFADRLRKVRTDVAQLNQKAFARELGLNQTTYSTYEAGRHAPRDVVAFAKRIELLTGVPASWTLGLDDVVSTPASGGEEITLR